MVYLRSGRATSQDANVPLIESLKMPKVPMGGTLLLYPMRVGQCILPDGSKKGRYLAIVGKTTTCIGHGDGLVSAADDAAFKMDSYFEDDEISDVATCYAFEDDPFHMERDLLETGMHWGGPVSSCTLFLIVAEGKVVSFGWKKKEEDIWRVYEQPKFLSLH